MNILKHEYVPPHIKLTEDEKKELYSKFNIINDKQLPEIPYMDPVSRVIFSDQAKYVELSDMIRFHSKMNITVSVYHK